MFIDGVFWAVDMFGVMFGLNTQRVLNNSLEVMMLLLIETNLK